MLKLGKRILVLKCLLYAVCFAWHTQAIGSDWLYLKDSDTQNWIALEDSSHVSFQGPMLKFEYLIVRERPEDRKPGAILVQVVRKYDPKNKLISNLRAQTILIRNTFPQKAPLDDEEVVRELYELYHRYEVENTKLRHDFHAKFPPAKETNEPAQKRKSFLFGDPYGGQTTHRAYLLYYSGIGSNGSRIPFYVGVSKAFERILITVVELDPLIGVGFVPRRTELIKK